MSDEISSMPTISVVIPCYRQARYLGEALESVLAQGYETIEILVIDDGSPDDTAIVARRYPNVRYIRQSNRGLSAARNRGLRASRGKYVLFLDADDHLLPGHFDVSLQTFREHPDCAFVFGAYRFFGAGAQENIHDCRPRPDHYATLLRSNCIGTVAVVLYKRDVLIRVGGFREDLPAWEDYDLTLRIVRQYPVACHHQVVAEYRRHLMQMSANLPLMLTAGIHTLNFQRPFIKGRKEYEEAYRHGVRRCRLLYGDPLVWEMVTIAKLGRWRTAFRYLWVLIRYHPHGLGDMLQKKLHTTITSARQRRARPS
jgi:glycosyltransferase involved in cell wall biosynthesis